MRPLRCRPKHRARGYRCGAHVDDENCRFYQPASLESNGDGMGERSITITTRISRLTAQQCCRLKGLLGQEVAFITVARFRETRHCRGTLRCPGRADDEMMLKERCLRGGFLHSFHSLPPCASSRCWITLQGPDEGEQALHGSYMAGHMLLEPTLLRHVRLQWVCSDAGLHHCFHGHPRLSISHLHSRLGTSIPDKPTDTPGIGPVLTFRL
ncbi:hypothetical protein VTK56DRAFT_6108 [Thermocarpiscus australiensis]